MDALVWLSRDRIENVKLEPVVCVAIRLKLDVSAPTKLYLKMTVSLLFIHNWLSVIVRASLLVHQEAYFTSGSSQEKASTRFLVASLLSTPTWACMKVM